MSSITDLLDHSLKTYESFIVIGDFNVSETSLKLVLDPFLDKQKCNSIIKNKICFKSVKESCTDLILTSRPSLHQFTNVSETGIDDDDDDDDDEMMMNCFCDMVDRRKALSLISSRDHC